MGRKSHGTHTNDYNGFQDEHKVGLAGYWAPPPNTECDTPIQLVNATFAYIKDKLIPDIGGIKFVVWTGDNVRHDNDNRYPRKLKQIYSSNEFMARKMQDVFGDDKYSSTFVPVIPTVGNNDIYPHNIMFAGPNSQTIAAYKNMWKIWIPSEQLHTFDRGAYFHVPVASKLSVLSLNSLYFYENNKAVDDCKYPTEPGSLQLDWLQIQLSLFRQQQRKVWIIGHIPPTDRQWYDGCFNRYADLMIEYRDIVVGQLFGHVNIDHFYFMEHSTRRRSSVDRLEPMDERISITAKNPLDLLNDVRQVFDHLPELSTQALPRSDKDIDSMIGHLAVINVAPSVVPNYYPTLRVYEYIAENSVNQHNLVTSDPPVRPGRPSTKLEVVSPTFTKAIRRAIVEGLTTLVHDKHGGKGHKRRKKKKKKKLRPPVLPPVDSLGPAYIQQLYSPLKLVQYYLNTTEANINRSSTPQYRIEYDTSQEPYAMPDLTVGSWVILGNKISGLRNPEGSFDYERFLTMFRDATFWGQSEMDRPQNVMKKRNDKFWNFFVARAFVCTGLEKQYKRMQQE